MSEIDKVVLEKAVFYVTPDGEYGILVMGKKGVLFSLSKMIEINLEENFVRGIDPFGEEMKVMLPRKKKAKRCGKVSKTDATFEEEK